MYTEFYGLREPPFNVTPDPRFLYLNDCYQEALAALTYGIDARKGFIALVGEAGTGKTTLLRRVLDTLGPSTRSVLLLNPTVTFDEILEFILLELGIPLDGSGKLVRLQRLNEFLLEHTRAGGNVALLIDEAQDLSPGVLEELRLLSNLETAREKLLQIILAGQPELETLLADPRMRQVRQRITLRVALRPLSSGEVPEYMRSRLELTGAIAPGPFTRGAVERIAALSQGVPRVVNVLSDAALLLGFALGTAPVTAAIVDEAWRDFELRHPPVLPAPEASPAPPPPAPAPTPSPAPIVAQPAAAERPSRPEPDDRDYYARAEAPSEAPAEVERPPARVAPLAPPAAAKSASESKFEPEEDASPPEPEEPAAERDATPRRTLNVPLAAAAIVIFAVSLHLTQRRFPGEEGPVPDEPVAAVPDAVEKTAAPVAAPEPAPDVLAAVTVTPGEAHASTPPARAADESVSLLEAATVVERFRRAFEARDPDQLATLFASDAAENGREGRDAIASAYRTQLAALEGVRYELPELAIAPQGDRIEVRAPFVISYRAPTGDAGEIRGRAEWAVERRDGHPLIVAFDYRVDPTLPR